MAEGAQQLPTDEELFEHPAADPPAAEPMEVDQVVETEQDAPQMEQVEQPIEEPAPIVPMVEPVVEHYRNAYQDHHEPPQYYPEQQEPAPMPTVPVFQPTAYVAPTFVSQADGNGAEGGSPDNGRNDANEHTVWIDSDEETEEIILRQNFYLSYSDHNYDCADPTDRVVHPQGKALPKIGGLDEAGNIVNQWEEGMAAEPTSPSQIHLHSQPLQQQPRRPVNSTGPFAIGGAQVDYMHQRPIRDPPQVRYDYGNGQMAQRVRPNQQLMGARGPRGDVLFHPQVGGVRAGSVIPQRRSQPLVGSAAYMPQQARRPAMGIQRGPAIQGQPRQAAVRPVQLTRPLGDMTEREFEHHQPPQQQTIVPTPAIRRAPEMAPHRMTPEQRSEMARGRSMAQFPMNDHSPLRGQNRPMIRGQSVANPMLMRGRNEDLLRSPQRMVDQSAQHHHPNLEMTTSPRKFQVKVTDSYSAPIAPKINELPAQLTEDPPEEDVAAGAADDQVLGAAGESPLRQGGSPVKGGQKPTPPHRLQHDEKNAHLAKLAADKEKCINPTQPLVQHAPMAPPSNHVAHQNVPEPIAIPPVPVRHHQDDALAMVQSVFDTTKPRLPDTPKDKEAISKIAENLRFSAEQYEKMPSTSAVGPNRRRHDSGMSGGHGAHTPYHPPDKRYELAAHQRLQNQQVAASSPVIPLRQPNNQMEPPHRPRGRPRGSTSAANAQKNRGPEPVAPHRVGGARTLPPRAQQQQLQNNGVTEQANSDSESEGVDEDWVMRCHCGMEHSTGATIECEQCKSWQHTFCMGLKEKDNTDGYNCELCMPRKLPITKAEAVRIQKKEVAKTKKAAEEEKRKKRNKRKSEPIIESKKPSTSNSRKSAPMHLDTRPTQLNEYSKAAASLLEAMSMTAGADTLLQESAEMKRAKRMFVSENVQALVTTMMVNQRAVVLEVNGFVSMVNEVKRQPGGGGYVFMYDGLMKGTAGEDMGDGHELVCVDTKKRGNDSKFTRRSCEPNCVLKHVLGSHATLGVMIVATKDIPYNQEVTLPFDLDWTQSDEPLECADHVHNMDACPFEIQRRVVAAKRADERISQELALKLKMEAEKRDMEERKRLEDEVRREREEVQAKLDEEEREQERLEAEKKAQEKEEAKKKKKEAKEAEKAARKSEEISASARQSMEPTSSNREQRRVQQAEEMFRRIDEESRKKEKKRSMSVAAEPSSSSTSARRSSARKSVVTPKKEEPSTSDSRRTSRRLESINSTVSDRTVSPPGKRPRASTTNTGKNGETNKRNASRLSSTPAAKRAKTSVQEPKSEPEDPAELTIKKLREVLHQNSMDVVTVIPREEYKNPDSLELPPVSEWVVKLIAPSRVEEDRAVARHKEKRERRQKIIAEAQPSASTPSSSRDRKKSETAKKEKVTVAQKEIKEEPVEIKKEVEAPVEPQEPIPEAPEEVKTEVKEEVVKPPSPKKEKVKAPKKLSLSEYKQRKAANNEAGASTPTTSAAPVTRRGFIPSTEGSNTANVQLSTIRLEDHLKPSSSSAPPPPPPPPPPAEVDSSEDEPAAHKQSLAARVAGLIGMPAPATPPASSTPNTRARKSRWQ